MVITPPTAIVYVENFLVPNSFLYGHKKRQTLLSTLLAWYCANQSMCMLIGLPQCGHTMCAASSLLALLSAKNSAGLQPIASAILHKVETRMSLLSDNNRDTDTRFMPSLSARSI